MRAIRPILFSIWTVAALAITYGLGAPSDAQDAAPAATPGTDAHTGCARYQDVAVLFAQRFHEAPVARMLAQGGFIIEIMASPDGASYSILAVQANGQACLLAAGSDFALVPAAPVGNPS